MISVRRGNPYAAAIAATIWPAPPPRVPSPDATSSRASAEAALAKSVSIGTTKPLDREPALLPELEHDRYCPCINGGGPVVPNAGGPFPKVAFSMAIVDENKLLAVRVPS